MTVGSVKIETPASRAQAEISAAVVSLTLAGVPPHIIAATMLSNLTLAICSASPDVATAHKALNGAAAILKQNKRLAPMLVRSARTAQHAVAASVPQGKPQ